ncbi:MAG: ribonuclease Z [Clostridium sp.]|uniref:ribonuclease Z n=1 Tax=Clostridium sp. TaxID=1506 RepID=UPI003F310E4A
MIDICLVGCGGGMPMPYRNLSVVLINVEGRKILIDCGEGTQVSMRMASLGFKAIDVICISHIHGDHVNGMTGLLGTIGNSGRTEPLTIIGPEGTKELIQSYRLVAKYIPYEINVIENPSEVNFNVDKKGIKENIEDSNLILKTLELEHSAPCLGYSLYIKRKRKFSVEKAMENNIPKTLWSTLQKNKSIVHDGKKYEGSMVLGEERRGIKISFVTDSRPLDTIKSFINESNLFICEGTYGDNGDIDKAIKNKHMTFSEAATLAKAGNVNRLLLTHFTPAMMEPEIFKENATDIFKNTIVGEDRLTMSLKYES